jgi:hypothetical protein
MVTVIFERLVTVIALLSVGSEVALRSEEAYGSELRANEGRNEERTCRDH